MCYNFLEVGSMQLSEIKKIINNGSEEEKVILRDYFKKYGNTLEKEEEVHNILVDTILNLSKEEVVHHHY